VAEPLSGRPDAENVADDAGAAIELDPSLAAAEYLGDMIAQLESIARTAGMDLVVYLLSMARVEAESNARLLGYGGRSPQRRL
jgi:hypothetical protein